MPGIAELGTVMMMAAERRMAVVAANLSNVSTPSFQARRVFSRVVDLRQAMPVDLVSFAKGGSSPTLKATGDPLDIAVEGDAMLMLRAGDRYLAVNSVQLRKDAEGRLVDPAGRALQAFGGGDVIFGSGAPTILRDGTVLIGGQAVTRIGLFRAGDREVDGTVPGLPEANEESTVMQGYVVPSDVDTAEQMIELTKASRLAETGARVFQIYDDLLGRTTSKLGELGR